MACGLSGALSMMVTAPVRGPRAAGVKVTVMMQLAPAASVAPQVFVCVASPVAAMLAMFSAVVPILTSVAVCGALAMLKPCAGKTRLVVDKPASIDGAGTQVPVTVMDCEPLGSLSVIVTAPLQGPDDCGANMTLIRQPAPGVSAGGQELVSSAAPLAAMLAIASDAEPLLLSDTVRSALVVPRA